MTFLDAAILRYYSKNQSSEIISMTQEKISPDIHKIEPAFLCIFFDMLTKEPCHYWSMGVYHQTYSVLSQLCKGQTININDKIFEHFLIGYGAYRQVTDIIIDLEKINDSPEIKNRLYRIPTYISIVEGCLTNLFRCILLILDLVSTKDFGSQKKLGPICEILKSNGFDLLVKDVNINIRNAVNHGGVVFKVANGGQVIEFIYNEKGQTVVLDLKTYEFDNLINTVYDVASGVLLGICHFINNVYQSISIERTKKDYLSFSLFSMELSMPTVRCKSISGLPDDKQLNLDFYIVNSDRTFMMQTAIEIVMLAYSRFNDYSQYMVSFSNERLQSSWIRFTNKDVDCMISKKKDLSEVLTEIIQRMDCLIWDASTEEIDLQEVKYFRFPNYSTRRFKINKVEDASIPERKRLKAHLFINDITEKSEIIVIINQAIEWLKQLKNPPSPTLPHKHGTMEADSLYINVYRHDSRKDKELYPNNDNFICMVDYNIDGITSLKYGGIFKSIWSKLHHEKIGNIQIAWREGKYAIKRNALVIGRNDPCPCGSGKKYKKCCIDKI